MICNPINLTAAEIEELKIGAEKHPLELAKTELGSTIAKAMRSACPVPGDTWDKFMTVLLEQDEEIPTHSHKRHAILFYPEQSEHLLVAGLMVFPAVGGVLYFPPGIEHSVPPVTRTRLSIAMLVSE